MGSYVRDRGVLSLEEAVHKVTAEPARRLGLTDRGVLQRAWPRISCCSTPRQSRTGRPRPIRPPGRPGSRG